MTYTTHLLLLLCILTSQAPSFYIANAFVITPIAFHSKIRSINAGEDNEALFHKRMIPHHAEWTKLISEDHTTTISQFTSSIFLSIDDNAAAKAIAEQQAMASLQGLRTFFGVSLGLIVGAVGIYFVTGALIIPKAAERLEKDTKRLRPGLWEEYVAKANLKEGETMTNRPELMQELTSIIEPLVMAEFEKDK